MRSRRSLRVLALTGAIVAAALAGAACRKSKDAPAGPHAVLTQRPYTPVRPPPTRTLKPGERTPLPRLPE